MLKDTITNFPLLLLTMDLPAKPFTIKMASWVADDETVPKCDFCSELSSFDVYWIFDDEKTCPVPGSGYACEAHYQQLKSQHLRYRALEALEKNNV